MKEVWKERRKEGSTQAAPEPKKELDWQDITIHRDGGGGGGAGGLLGQADLVKAVRRRGTQASKMAKMQFG